MKYLSIAVLSIAASLAFGTHTHAATPPDSCFAFNAGTGTITDYYDNEANNSANPACTRDVDIPSTIGGTPVTAIGNLGFYYNQLEAVTIPASVLSIGSYAFAFNNLTTVTVPNAAATMQHDSFSRNSITAMTIGANTYTEQTPTTDLACFAITGSTVTDYYIHSPIVARDNGVLCGHQVSIPASVTVVGNNAFYNNELTAVTIPDGVTSIGTSAFGNSRFTDVTIPSSVTNIGDSAFNFGLLTSVIIENGSATMTHGIFNNNPINSMTIGGTTYLEQTPTTEAACFDVTGAILDDYHRSSPLVARDNGVLCGGDISIPEGIGIVGGFALQYKQLTSVILPDSVTIIDDYAFWSNKIESLTFGSGLTSIGRFAFLMNSIQTVTVPSSLTDISHDAFTVQSQWGTDIENGVNGAPSIYSGVASEVQAAYDSIWHVRLYTEDPSNPANLLSSSADERSWGLYDDNSNGLTDSIGGYIVNPASANVRYVDALNTNISTNRLFTGLINDEHIYSYLVSDGPNIPIPADDDNPTPSELLAIDEAFNAYYRIGDSVAIDPPAISGYITPEPQTFVLGAADNTFSYVYAAADSPGGGAPATPVSDEDELADTGISSIVYAVSALAMTSLGALILTRRV